MVRASEIDFENYMSIYKGIKKFEGNDFAKIRETNPNAPNKVEVNLTGRVVSLLFIFENVQDEIASERYINSFLLDRGFKNFDLKKSNNGNFILTAVFKASKKK